MHPESIFSAKNIKTVIFYTLICIIISGIVSVIQTPKYRASLKALVVAEGQFADPYAAGRTTSYVTNILSEVVHSTSFINQVLVSGFEVKDTFGADSDVRIKNWKKTVLVSADPETGIISINVLDSDRRQAQAIAEAIAHTLATQHLAYHGSTAITLKIIDNPAVSNRLAQPDIASNLLFGLLAGLLIGLTFIVIFPRQRLLEFLFDRASFYRDESLELDRRGVISNIITGPDYTNQTKPSGRL